MNDVSMKAMQNQIDMVKNELRNEMKTSIQTSLSNQTNEIKNMMASLLQMNTASTSRSGSFPGNTVANPKGELKAITTRSGLVTDGLTVLTPPKSVTPEVDERVEETYTDPDLTEYTIKVPPPLEKLQELANTPLNENCSAVILKRLPEKLGDPGIFLILCGFKVTHEIHDSEGCNFLSEELPDINSFNDIHPHFDDNPLSGSTTYSSNSLLEEFTDKLALITYPPDYNDNLQFDIESDLREIEFSLYQGKDSGLKDSIDQTDLANLDAYFVDLTPEMFTDEHAPDYSSPSRFDVYDDDFLEVESDADNVYDDPFDSKGEKIKESKLLIDELDLPCDFLPYFEYDSFNS
nr:reverse transcriptase domain-containing protein [Tanacetum cinerariifolium]